jgi:hypothetical protein
MTNGKWKMENRGETPSAMRAEFPFSIFHFPFVIFHFGPTGSHQ